MIFIHKSVGSRKSFDAGKMVTAVNAERTSIDIVAWAQLHKKRLTKNLHDDARTFANEVYFFYVFLQRQ